MLDRYLPEYDVRSCMSVAIGSTPAVVFAAIGAADFGRSPIVRTLFALRSLPARFARRRAKPLQYSLAELRKNGFIELYRSDLRTVAFGLIGQFWTPSGRLRRFDAEEFVAFGDANYAKAVWDFVIEPAAGGCILRTETRVRCPSARTRLAFRAYWLFIGPFSALIRREMLRLIRETAEGR